MGRTEMFLAGDERRLFNYSDERTASWLAVYCLPCIKCVRNNIKDIYIIADKISGTVSRPLHTIFPHDFPA